MKLIIILLLTLVIIQCKKAQEKKVGPSFPSPTLHTRDADLERWREIISKEPYVLNTKDLPNPFLSPKIQQEIVSSEEMIPLELVGIVEKNGKRVALLQDSLRKGYIVKTGDKLGESRIREIGKNYIIIEEIAKDSNGKKTVKIRTINLRKE